MLNGIEQLEVDDELNRTRIDWSKKNEPRIHVRDSSVQLHTWAEIKANFNKTTEEKKNIPATWKLGRSKGVHAKFAPIGRYYYTIKRSTEEKKWVFDTLAQCENTTKILPNWNLKILAKIE